jgi:hypothetical protein
VLDHLVLATPDLLTTTEVVAARTGVTPVAGGRHLGIGTANTLLGLGDGAYLEIIGPDPRAEPGHAPRPFRIDELADARLVTWAVRPPDLDATLATARERGYDAGAPYPMQRRTDDGELLRWRLTRAEYERSDGLVPFLIDWGDTPHPTSRPLPEVRLREFTGTHPDPEAVRTLLSALGVRLDVTPGPAGLYAVLDTPNGAVAL